MEITRFEDLLAASRAQSQPQRLLFVFAAVELPDDATADEHAGFARGEGGALVPQMCVDKAPDELNTFADLVAEAAQFGKPWGIVFAAAMSGRAGAVPTTADADEPLERMIAAIQGGRFDGYVPFDPQGEAVQIG
jgi:hypothetical protein